MTIEISGLFTYPIKSCGALAHQQVQLVDTGPIYDRQWVVTDEDGMFFTQRAYPALAQVQPSLQGEMLAIDAPGMRQICVPLTPNDEMARRDVTVWRDEVVAADQGQEAADWFSDYLGLEARLFTMPKTTTRPVDPDYAPRPAKVGFADAYPLLVIGEASLAALNARLAQRGAAPVPMSRFRPNVVISGSDAFEEDTWGAFRMGELVFDAVKPCARCSVTTVDQQTGQVPNPQEPLATLATFRNQGGKVMFGQNLVHRQNGTLAVGDALTPLD